MSVIDWRTLGLHTLLLKETTSGALMGFNSPFSLPVYAFLLFVCASWQAFNRSPTPHTNSSSRWVKEVGFQMPPLEPARRRRRRRQRRRRRRREKRPQSSLPQAATRGTASRMRQRSRQRLQSRRISRQRPRSRLPRHLASDQLRRSKSTTMSRNNNQQEGGQRG